jgi:hypothetical protein
MAAASTRLPAGRTGYPGLLPGGLIAGVLDISAAFIDSGLRGRKPMGVLQGVASGVLGAGAVRAGFESAILGAILHFLIAFAAAAVYYAASRRMKFLLQHAIGCGLLYGVAIYLVMTYVVVPLSAAPFRLGTTPSAVLIGVLVHMVCIGLPISLAVKKYAS